ncbi:ATP-binding protein [Nocardia sp. CY41]|uniref:ATP-binding protein n=1 Tax=Nocardia sp. CY41 TaxID=2608686 RepID=UPI00135C29AD|nr:AAA family ATPase [Nocardia sp. CY41]
MSLVQARGDVLPASTSEFIGRETELDRLGTLLDGGARLITLVGPGGIGKTRLAAEALRRGARALRRPVYWARLAGLEADSTATAQDVMQSAVRADLDSPPTHSALVRTFSSGDRSTERAVLVLDNCEHLLGAVAAMIAELLEAAPGLTILATSREPIGWADEYILPVPPLSPRQSLELFRQRAQLIGRAIPDEREPMDVAARICLRVDHNPLFVRLAAARLRHQPPAMVLRELTGDADDKRLHWKHGARAGAEQRHRGVYDVVAWSFALCSASEQLLLERLSVFAAGYETDDESLRGGIELDAAIAVCADDTLPASEIERLLERLTEQSLLSAHLTATTVSWYLVQSVRVFARDRLRRRDRGEADRLAARHRRYFRDKVVAGQAIWLGPQDQAWLAWARSAWNDIVLAIESGLSDPTEAVVALEIATVLLSMKVPYVRSGAGALTRLTERALEATRASGLGPSGLADLATALLGWISLWQGRTEHIPQLLADRADLPPGAGPRYTDTDFGLPAPVEWMWGLELMLVYGDPRAVIVLTRARRKFADQGDRIGAERSEVFATFCSALVGDRRQALEHTARFLERSMSSGSTLSLAWAEIARAVALAKHGSSAEALTLTHGVLTRYRGERDTWTASWAVGAHIVALAQILVARRAEGSDPAACADAATEIAYLIGGFKTRQRSMGISVDRVPLIAAELRGAAELARAVLGDRAYAAAERRTRLRPELDALWCPSPPAEQMQTARRPDRPAASRPVSRRPASRWNDLSEAERDVAVFAAAGWPNSAIAGRRRSSIRTVDAQVAAIRQKLMIASRADIAAHIPDDLADRVRYESERRPSRGRRGRSPRAH